MLLWTDCFIWCSLCFALAWV